MLKLSYNVSDVFLMVLKLSCKVSECKPLPGGGREAAGGGGTGGTGLGYGQGLTLVHFSATPKPLLQLKIHPKYPYKS